MVFDVQKGSYLTLGRVVVALFCLSVLLPIGERASGAEHCATTVVASADVDGGSSRDGGPVLAPLGGVEGELVGVDEPIGEDAEGVGALVVLDCAGPVASGHRSRVFKLACPLVGSRLSAFPARAPPTC